LVEVSLFGWVVFGAAILLVAVVAAAEVAITTVDRNHLRKLAAEGETRAARLIEALDRSAQLWLSVMLARTLALLAAGLALGVVWQDAATPWTFLLTLVTVWLLTAVAHVASRALVLPYIDRIALWMAPFVHGVMLVFSPVTYLLMQMGGRLGSPDDVAQEETIFLSEDGLRRLMNVHDEASALQESEREMIVNILEMDDTVAREVMVPRIDMVTLPVDSSVQQALETIIAVGHSRIPVYDGEIDVIVGLLYAKDLLQCMRDHRSEADLRALLRPAYFVPASKKVDDLLREMQLQRIHLAMVVDEYGGIAGLVTIENIIEEIFGDIRDEYDVNEAQLFQAVSDDSYLFDSRLDLETLSKLLDVDLTEEDADTLGGLIYAYLGRVPTQGESIDLAGWQFTVMSLKGRRIGQVRADRLPPPAAETPAESEPERRQRHSLLGPANAPNGSLRTADT
jgi:CBS domain containing-hemolysin-like protein